MVVEKMPSGVVFVIDRVMHYHAATMRAIESGLLQRGIPFAVLSAQDQGSAVGRVAMREKVVGNHRHFELTERKVGRFIFRFQHGLSKACAEINPAVVVSTCHSGTLSEWLLLVWARRKGIRRVAWQCGYEYNPTLVKRVVLHRFVPLFNFHLCYHSNAQRYAAGYGADNLQTLVMHNTIDESKIVKIDKGQARAGLISRYPMCRDKKIVLYVGAVLEEKRLDLVFQALDLLSNPDIVFMLVGDGPYLPALKKRYAMRSDWISTGNVIDGVGIFFDAADVFVLPGTGGLAINEGMAHGTAVIAGYADGSADDLVVDGVTGFRLQGDGAEELSLRLVDVLSDPKRALEMGAQGEQLIRGRLSFRSFIDRVVTTLADQHEKACANT